MKQDDKEPLNKIEIEDKDVGLLKFIIGFFKYLFKRIINP